MVSSKIVKRVPNEKLHEILRGRRIVVSSEALFRLSEGQRKIFKEENLIHLLLHEKPRLIGVQANGRYAAFFRRKEGFIRIIFAAGKNIEIITFFITGDIPRWKAN